MFTFPLAVERETWIGQGALFPGQMMPYFGGGSLGVCFGFSAVWLSKGAPFPAKDALFDNAKAQAIQKSSMENPTAEGLQWAVEDNLPSMKAEKVHKYGGDLSGVVPSSHVILDLLATTDDVQFILSFWYRAEATSETVKGHAIAVQIGPTAGRRIMDPNYGVAQYDTNTALCNDLHRLLASYVERGGWVTEVVCFEYSIWGEFQGF